MRQASARIAVRRIDGRLVAAWSVRGRILDERGDPVPGPVPVVSQARPGPAGEPLGSAMPLQEDYRVALSAFEDGGKKHGIL